MRYWLDLGIKGFRIDAITFIKKDLSFKSREADGIDGLVGLGEVSENHPGIELFLEEMKRETYQKYDAFTVAEISRVSDSMLEKMTGKDGLFHSIFDFSYLDLDVIDGKWHKKDEITASKIKDKLFHSQLQAQNCGGYLSVVLENHDQNRSINKYLKSAQAGFAGASMLGTWNLTLRGVPFIYQGEEIGMVNQDWESLNEFDDISTIGQYKMALLEGIGEEEAFKLVAQRSRDNVRTPMQWDESENAGFSQEKPWLPVNKNYKEINVKVQMGEKESLLEYYRKLIALRKTEEYGQVLTNGTISFPICTEENLIAYKRCTKDKELLIVLNFEGKEVAWPKEFKGSMHKIMGNYEGEIPNETGKLRPYEALIIKCL